MNLKVRFWLLSLALVGSIVLSACGGGGGGGGGGAAPSVTAQDTLKFDPAAVTVKSGGTVNFKNGGTQKHNFVVVATADADKVDADAAAKAGDATGVAGVLSGGKLVDAGASESVTISAPAGTYTYLCTVPGHYQAGMKGTLTVQ